MLLVVAGSVILGGVADGVAGDVADVVVGERVAHLSADAPAGDDAGRPHHLEVLRNGWLGHAQGVDQLVDAAIASAELDCDLQAGGVTERPEQFGGRDECFVGDRIDGWAIHRRLSSGRSLGGQRHAQIITCAYLNSIFSKSTQAIIRPITLTRGQVIGRRRRLSMGDAHRGRHGHDQRERSQ